MVIIFDNHNPNIFVNLLAPRVSEYI